MKLATLILIAYAYQCFAHDDSTPIKFRGINEITGQRKLRGHMHATEDSPRTCGVVTPSIGEMEKMHNDMYQKLESNKEQGKANANGAVIDVYFHIIVDSSNNGYVTPQQIDTQIQVLNSAFQGGGWSFVLAGTEYVTNNVWYSTLEDDEVTMKRALRRGTGETLNIYSGRLATLLGWAYFPSTYNWFYAYYDGVVVDYRSFPGGSYNGYNGGDTGAQ